MPQTWRSASKTNPCLKELSALWEADQQQQLESANSMHAWMKDIGQLVKDFARQAEQRSSALQEQVQRLEESVKDLKPQLGRTEASAKDLKQQVEILAADYKEIAEVLRGV